MIPKECFSERIAKKAHEVVLIDDNIKAFDGYIQMQGNIYCRVYLGFMHLRKANCHRPSNELRAWVRLLDTSPTLTSSVNVAICPQNCEQLPDAVL